MHKIRTLSLSMVRLSQDWHGGTAGRDFVHHCTEAQSSLFFRYPMIGTVLWFYAYSKIGRRKTRDRRMSSLKTQELPSLDYERHVGVRLRPIATCNVRG